MYAHAAALPESPRPHFLCERPEHWTVRQAVCQDLPAVPAARAADASTAGGHDAAAREQGCHRRGVSVVVVPDATGDQALDAAVRLLQAGRSKGARHGAGGSVDRSWRELVEANGDRERGPGRLLSDYRHHRHDRGLAASERVVAAGRRLYSILATQQRPLEDGLGCTYYLEKYCTDTII